ncbi:MAG: glycosyltransferase [Chromatiaceae bacterium]|nr:glycosyltransferase [Chromatiaceae bacterium]
MATSSRICLFSQRHLLREFHRCANYEFEDIICGCDDIDLIAPRPRGTETAIQRWRNRLAYRMPSFRFDPGIEPMRIAGDYDLFLTTCEFVNDLQTFDLVNDWKKSSRISACYLSELWVRAISDNQRLVSRLADFDHIFVNCAASVEPLSAQIGRPCHYLPPAVDAIRYCPWPNPQWRSIDVYSMGRRDAEMHRELLQARQRDGLFYLYDSYDIHSRKEWCVSDYREHRMLSAQLIQRSRYFIVNPAKLDCGAETAGQQEVGNRFFEGAAGGSVMIGRPVDTDIYRSHFDWEDAVIPVYGKNATITDVIADLNRQPERVELARRNNVREALMRHDWVYRWEQILAKIGMQPSHKLNERKAELARLKNTIPAVYLNEAAAA